MLGWGRVALLATVCVCAAVATAAASADGGLVDQRGTQKPLHALQRLRAEAHTQSRAPVELETHAKAGEAVSTATPWVLRPLLAANV